LLYYYSLLSSVLLSLCLFLSLRPRSRPFLNNVDFENDDSEYDGKKTMHNRIYKKGEDDDMRRRKGAVSYSRKRERMNIVKED
jgi:hypothetical protein